MSMVVFKVMPVTISSTMAKMIALIILGMGLLLLLNGCCVGNLCF